MCLSPPERIQWRLEYWRMRSLLVWFVITLDGAYDYPSIASPGWSRKETFADLSIVYKGRAVEDDVLSTVICVFLLRAEFSVASFPCPQEAVKK